MDEKSFKTLGEFHKVYEEVRNDILIRHGYEKDAKVRLKNAIMMYQKFNENNWFKITSVKTDMIDRIKFIEACGKKGEYKLKAMV